MKEEAFQGTGIFMDRGSTGTAEALGQSSDCCLDCGAALLGPHCSICGQKARVHRNMMAIGHDMAHGILHLEGKFWRTLPELALRPGELTRRYIEGQR